MSRRLRAFLFLLLCIALGVTAIAIANRFVEHPLRVRIHPRVLVFHVPEGIDEGPAPASYSLDLLQPSQPHFHQLLTAMREAAEDHTVEGLVLHIDGVDWGWARVNEMCDAIEVFRASGKPVLATLGSGAEEKEYVLAAATGRIAIAPVGQLGFDGLSASAMFLRGAYDKLGIQPNYAHVGRYKSAVESYTRQTLSPDARAAMEDLLDDEYAFLVDMTARYRRMSPERVRELLDGGPYPAREAMACGLVDTLVSSHDLDSLAVDGGDHDTESFLDYASAAGTHNGPRIALLVAEGEIIDGRSRDGAFGGRSVGDETLIEALRDIADDDDVRALVLRIDSPGGSGDASEAVWHEIRRVRREKPVVVSLGDVAASGGYYLASAGDSVLASPATITGSIGVFGGKLNMLGLYQKLGLNVETVSRGRHAEMFSPWRDFTDEERERFQRQLEQFYTTFLERVAEGRGLEVAAVDSVGQGRVWSGRAAREHGLVDDFGGLHEAIGAARTLAGIEDGPVAIEEYPRPRQSLAQRWITDLLREEDASERLGLPGLDMLGQWVRLSGTRAGQVMAMLPYAIRID